MPSLRRHEGYLMIDNRAGGTVPDEIVTLAGMPVGSGRGLFEAPTYTCSHCQVVVVLNPIRTRERAYCPKCDHNICDGCGAARAANGGACKPFKQVLDEVEEAASRGQPVIILP